MNETGYRQSEDGLSILHRGRTVASAIASMGKVAEQAHEISAIVGSLQDKMLVRVGAGHFWLGDYADRPWVTEYADYIEYGEGADYNVYFFPTSAAHLWEFMQCVAKHETSLPLLLASEKPGIWELEI